MPFTPPNGIGVISGANINVTVPIGADRTALVPVVVHNGVSISPPSGVAQNFTNAVQYTVTAEDGSTKVYTVRVVEATTVPVDPTDPTQPSNPSGAMRLGTNFWYHTRLDDNWSGEAAMVPGINWATAYGLALNGVADTNIWRPAWLAELAPYSVLRFMDWGNTNWSQITQWAQRRAVTADNYEAYIDGTTATNNPGVAYEWLIDLCNRTGKDLWVCVPHQTSEEYWLALAELIQQKLNAQLRVYVEYSNETWNGSFGQFAWVNAAGAAGNLPGGNQFYQGQAFCLWQSLKIFESFKAVFGASAMGTRVVRVVSYGGNMDTMRQAFTNVYQSNTWNSINQTVDMLAIAPYIGHGLDGASATVQADFHAAIDSRLLAEIAEAVQDKTTFGIAQLGCYEGGQHLTNHADTWARNPNIYDEYRYMLDKWKQHFTLFNHYTHTGRWTPSQAWGALDFTGQSSTDAHKYRALTDWKLANP